MSAVATRDVPATQMAGTAPAVLRTQGLTKLYGHTVGVTDLDITLRRGEAFGLLGPNGAGKTTTIRTLLDFIRPTRGSATIFGLDSRRDSVAVKRRIGYLPAELALYDDMTGAELLRHFAALRGGVDWSHVDCARGRRGVAIGATAALALAAYLLNSLGSSVAVLAPYRKLSPFYWYIDNDPLRNGVDLVHLAALVGVTALLVGASVWTFSRRDVGV